MRTNDIIDAHLSVDQFKFGKNRWTIDLHTAALLHQVKETTNEHKIPLVYFNFMGFKAVCVLRKMQSNDVNLKVTSQIEAMCKHSEWAVIIDG